MIQSPMSYTTTLLVDTGIILLSRYRSIIRNLQQGNRLLHIYYISIRLTQVFQILHNSLKLNTKIKQNIYKSILSFLLLVSQHNIGHFLFKITHLPFPFEMFLNSIKKISSLSAIYKIHNCLLCLV